MALIRPVRGFTPKIGKDCFIAENATIVGEVTMGDECSIWFNTTRRLRIAHALSEINDRDRQRRVCRAQRNHPWRKDMRLCAHRHGLRAARRRGSGRRRDSGGRKRGRTEHKNRRARVVDGRTGQIQEDGRSCTKQGNEPEDSPQLSDVLQMVRGINNGLLSLK